MTTDGSYDNTDFITDTGPTSATKILNNLPVANYYIAMTTGWGLLLVGHLQPPLAVATSAWLCPPIGWTRGKR